jgi:sugar O-acyltransferase (sialic acid O-acetyltransferase NeuD family)
MEKLIIVGAGGFGREVLGYARDVQKIEPRWEIGGFLDDNNRALDNFNYNFPIIRSIQDYQPTENDVFVMALGTPAEKLAVADILIKRGARFISLIHPKAWIGSNVTLGIGCVVCPYTVITCDIRIGDFVTINVYASIGHDSLIGDGCTLSSYASIAGAVKLGNGVYVGIHGCILNGTEIGDFAMIGAGSMVLKHVKPGATVIGVPAKRVL